MVSFPAENPQLLKNDIVRWRQLVRQFVELRIHSFDVVKHRTTALRLILVLVLIQIFFRIECLYVNNRLLPVR
jgi:hypothetical protein